MSGCVAGPLPGAGELEGFFLSVDLLAIQSSKKPFSGIFGCCEAASVAALDFIPLCGEDGSGEPLGAFDGISGAGFWAGFGDSF